MKRIGFLVWLLAAACACKNGRGGGNGKGTATGTVSGECESARAHVEKLYRAEAAPAEDVKDETPEAAAERDEAVADNVTMVMNDCVTNPATIAGCLSHAGSVAELEDRCLIPLDDEGTEGEQLP